jgi:hypothetical protein
MEGMSLEDYTRFIVRASTTDPRPLEAAEQLIAPHIDDAKTITIETQHPQRRAPLKFTMGIEWQPRRDVLWAK